MLLLHWLVISLLAASHTDTDFDLGLLGNVFGSLTNHGRSCGRVARPGCMSGDGDEASARRQGSSGKNTTRASGSLHTWGERGDHLVLTWWQMTSVFQLLLTLGRLTRHSWSQGRWRWHDLVVFLLFNISDPLCECLSSFFLVLLHCFFILHPRYL